MKQLPNKFKATILVVFIFLLNTSISAQCYKSNLDVGKQQYNSGKYQTALATFEKSLKCPDAKGGSEANQWIKKCKSKIEEQEKVAEVTRLKEERDIAERNKVAEEKRIAEERKLAEEKRIAVKNKLKIGDNYAGGIIFYLDYTGKHGKVCANEDQSTGATWYDAKQICTNLLLNGYSDWYLPSKDELNQIYKNLHLKNMGGFANYYYWSSTEDDNNYAWDQYFGSGSQGYDGKSNTPRVRAVRAF